MFLLYESSGNEDSYYITFKWDAKGLVDYFMVNSELILIKAFFLIVEELVIIHCTSLKAQR